VPARPGDPGLRHSVTKANPVVVRGSCCTLGQSNHGVEGGNPRNRHLDLGSNLSTNFSLF
jgi:hypothetical protein